MIKAALETLDPLARDDLRRALIHDPGRPRRDRLSAAPLRDGRGDDWADIIDMLTMYPDARRRVVPLFGEIGAAATS